MRDSHFPCPYCGKEYMTRKRWLIYHKEKCEKKTAKVGDIPHRTVKETI